MSATTTTKAFNCMEMIVGDFVGTTVYELEGVYVGSFYELEKIGEEKQRQGFPSYRISAERFNEPYTGAQVWVPKRETISFKKEFDRDKFLERNLSYFTTTNI